MKTKHSHNRSNRRKSLHNPDGENRYRLAHKQIDKNLPIDHPYNQPWAGLFTRRLDNPDKSKARELLNIDSEASHDTGVGDNT